MGNFERHAGLGTFETMCALTVIALVLFTGFSPLPDATKQELGRTSARPSAAISSAQLVQAHLNAGPN